ncbi:MAG: archaeosortase/exosortase family protein [Candidatus Diapherotrites archaeon]|nr:archaeosortase/exosortase family protein [Candidatus Diapherotrites archaeon]
MAQGKLFYYFARIFFVDQMLKHHKRKIFLGGKFLLAFFIIFALLYTTTQFYLIGVETLFAEILNSLLQLIGISGKISVHASEQVVWLILEKATIQISFLCTGLAELFVLWAAFGASFGIPREKRILGCLQAVAVVLVFNVVRIFATTILLLNSGAEFADLAHDLLFRVSLFVVIAGFYWWWLNRKTLRKK